MKMEIRRLRHVFMFFVLVLGMSYSLTSFYRNDYNLYPFSTHHWTMFQLIEHRHSLFKLINPTIPGYLFDGPYIHENKELCSSVSNLTLLVIVLSSTSHFRRRQIFRHTWANEIIYTSFMNVRFVYLLGSVHNKTVQDDIDQEFSRYGDIVQGDFIDTYHNLTHKSTMGFKWATEHCRNAKYVMKTDDDVVINLFTLFQNDILNKSKESFDIYCHRKTNIIVRDERKKWYIEKEQLKGLTRYPPYCLGNFVIISNAVVPVMFELLTWSPFFPLEDVLIYGFILNEIKGIKFKQVEGNEVAWNPDSIKTIVKCLKELKQNCPINVYILKTINQIVVIWEAILKVYAND